MRRATVFVAALAVALVSGGCSQFMRAHNLAPNGLTKSDDGWRRSLVAGRGDSLHDVPGDELMRLLYLGTAAHYGGRYGDSNKYLEAAAALSDDRITKSLSRSALSLISNDGVLPYSPARTERLLIPYYAALNYIQLGNMEDAAVEARRLSALLQTAANNNEISGDVRPVHAALRSFTGAIYEATGNRNDALVAYRNAAALGAAVDTSALTAAPNATADSMGTVFVLLENGFVAHRVEQNLFVWLGTDEMHAFSTGGTDRERYATSVADRVVEAAFGPDRSRRPYGGPRANGRGDFYVPLSADHQRLAAERRAQCEASNRPAPRPHTDNGNGTGTDDRDHDRDNGRGSVAGNGAPPSIADAIKRTGMSGRVISKSKPEAASKPEKDENDSKPDSTSKPAKPVATKTVTTTEAPSISDADRRSRNCRDEDDVPYLLKVAWPVYTQVRAPGFASIITGTDTVSARFADLSAAVVQDYDAQLPLVVARTVARGAAKAAVTQSVKRKASEKSDGLGKLVGLLGNVGNVALENADTRSWHLLPAGLTVARVRVPAGSQHVSVTLPGQTGIVDLGNVDVRAGGISFVSKRAW